MSKSVLYLSHGRRECVTLEFIGMHLERLTTEVASLRDDMRVMAVILQHLDNSHSKLLTEVRSVHSQISRIPAAQGRGQGVGLMRIFARIRQVYDRLCKRIGASADRKRQEREHFSDKPLTPNERRERQIGVLRDSKQPGARSGGLFEVWGFRPRPESRIIRSIV
jgi:hypothetical protein